MESKTTSIPKYLSTTKVNVQRKELKDIEHNESLFEKAVNPIIYTIASAYAPFCLRYPNPIYNNAIIAENLLRRYYGGHETLGTGQTDNMVSKGTRGLFGKWDHHHAGPARRAIASYKKHCKNNSSNTVTPFVNLDKKTLPRTLLEFLKDELEAKGKSVDLKGDLAAVIYVIQEKCDIDVIDLKTINSEIAAAKAAKPAGNKSSSSAISSLWASISSISINPFASSSDTNDATETDSNYFDL